MIFWIHYLKQDRIGYRGSLPNATFGLEKLRIRQKFDYNAIFGKKLPYCDLHKAYRDSPDSAVSISSVPSLVRFVNSTKYGNFPI